MNTTRFAALVITFFIVLTSSSTEVESVITSYPQNVRTYAIGDEYTDSNGIVGIVYSVSSDGKHGKVISKRISSLGIVWDTTVDLDGYPNYNPVGGVAIGAYSETDGEDNWFVWEDFVTAYNKDLGQFPAFNWVKTNFGGQWYLPSRQELLDAYNNLSNIGKLSDKMSGRFWSSTENSEKTPNLRAYTVYLGDDDKEKEAVPSRFKYAKFYVCAGLTF